MKYNQKPSFFSFLSYTKKIEKKTLSLLLWLCFLLIPSIASSSNIKKALPSEQHSSLSPQKCAKLNAYIRKQIQVHFQHHSTMEGVRLPIIKAIESIIPEKGDFHLIPEYTEKLLIYYEMNHFLKIKDIQSQITDTVFNAYKEKLITAAKNFQEISNKIQLNCLYQESLKFFQEQGEWDIPLFNEMKPHLNPVVYGARKVMSTVYQSCDINEIPPITMQEALNIHGVKKIYRHKMGGWHRKISNIETLLDSHYYISHTDTFLCHNIKTHPLIYDFGGKPSVHSTPFNTLNFFQNYGSGSSLLGIDCSGFVFSSLASAGLRMKPNENIKLSRIINIGAKDFYASNHFKCLTRVPITSTPFLQEGDIVSDSSHVFIVDKILSSDPFHLNSITQKKDCHNLDVKDFQFIVIQSSPNIGINRMHVKEFTKGKGYYRKIELGLKQAGIALCYKKFGVKKKISNKLRVIRHTQSPECKEKEVYLTNQHCLKSCDKK